MTGIYEAWLAAKETERAATQERREIEDQLIESLRVPVDLDGTKSFEADGYSVKVVGRMNRKIDADLLQEIAAEHGLGIHLGSLFRWKPEINASAWKSAPESITAPLLGAITTTPGRPSFSISIKEQ